MFDLLLKGFAWVILIYSDNSKKHVWSTLQESEISKRGLRLKENYVYDFKRNSFISLDNVESVEINLEINSFDREVDKYASRFI